MDPDATLENIRDMSADYLSRIDGDGELDDSDVAALCKAIQALDNWIAKGGFLPSDWQKVRR